jgi:hypothetical protein
MRKFIMLAEQGMALLDEPAQEEGMPELEEQSINVPERLREIVFRLRAHSDDTGGDYSFGFESGCEMAAEMVENLLNAIEAHGAEENKSGS